MRYNKSFHWLLLALVGVTGAVNGQSFSTNINPALTSYQAFILAPDLSQTDRDYLFTNEWRNQSLPDRFGNLVSQYDNEFRLLRRATQFTAPCDWGIDWIQGPDTMLPHLSRVKMAANTARLRVMWDLQHDRPADAQADLLAALTLGRNGGRDGSLIGVLVQFAVERIVCQTVAENYNHFSPEILGQLAEGIDAPTPARATIKGNIPNEKKYFAHWIVDRVLAVQAENPGNDAKVMETLEPLMDRTFATEDAPKKTNDVWPRIVAAAGGTSDGIVKLLRDLDPLYDKLQAIEALPFAQYEEQIQPFNEEIDNSTNPFVRELFPALKKLRPREFCANADLAMVRAAVQYKLNGTVGLNSVTNPVGQGPFSMQRFVFDGVDRGFELSAGYDGLGYPEVFIFVETDGPPFLVFGKRAGEVPPP